MASKRKLTLLRSAKTRAEGKYTIGGRLRTAPRAPITLARLKPARRFLAK